MRFLEWHACPVCGPYTGRLTTSAGDPYVNCLTCKAIWKWSDLIEIPTPIAPAPVAANERWRELTDAWSIVSQALGRTKPPDVYKAWKTVTVLIHEVAFPPAPVEVATVADEYTALVEAAQAVADSFHATHSDRSGLVHWEVSAAAMKGLHIALHNIRRLAGAGGAVEEIAIIHPAVNPSPCPDCQSPRYWEQLSGGGVNSVCLSCGRRGANDHLAADGGEGPDENRSA